MSSLFLWGGVTMLVAFAPVPMFKGLTIAGLLMVVGMVLLILKK